MIQSCCCVKPVPSLVAVRWKSFSGPSRGHLGLLWNSAAIDGVTRGGKEGETRHLRWSHAEKSPDLLRKCRLAIFREVLQHFFNCTKNSVLPFAIHSLAQLRLWPPQWRRFWSEKFLVLGPWQGQQGNPTVIGRSGQLPDGIQSSEVKLEAKVEELCDYLRIACAE